MPTWPELQAHVRSKYKLMKDEEKWFSLSFGFDDQRSQVAVVRTFDAFNQPWIEISARICKEDEMSPRVALQKNWNFAVGSIALDDQGFYMFVHRAALDTMDPAEFELPLLTVCRTADELERNYAGKDAF